MRKLTSEQIERIKRAYDSNPNMTLKELSQITGINIVDLKIILMEG
jgi:hypothetical protein